MSAYDATTDLHDSYYAAVGELRRRHVAERLRLECGDCLAVIPRLVAEGVVVDAIVTDPPYGLEFMGKEWDSFRGSNGGIEKSGYGKLGQHGTPVFDANRRNQKCPSCMKWAYDYPDRKCICGGAGAEGRRIYCRGFQQWSEAWARACFEILRPGGYLVAFGGTRTYHRLVCAIEDAGFVIQDQLAWLYGSGFPKHRSHLKPAHEPICLAYKPGGKRTMQVDECRVEHRTVDGGSLATNPHLRRHINGGNGGNIIAHEDDRRVVIPHQAGRWPANVVHDGSAEVLAGFPDSAGQQGDVKGTEPSNKINHVFTKFNGRSAFARRDEPSGTRRYTETGATDFGAMPGMRREATSAARFFYAAKADAHDRWGSRHPTVKPVDLIRWLVTLVVPPGGTFLDPFAGSGTAAVAALASGRDAILIERDAAYVADIRERIAHYAGEGRHSLAAKGRGRAARTTGTLL